MASQTQPNEQVQTDTTALVSAIERLSEGREFSAEVDGREVPVFVDIPKGRTLLPLKDIIDAVRLRPERRVGSAEFHDQASFIEHVNRFKSESSAIFAYCTTGQNPSARITAVLNYHAADGTSFNDHLAVYSCPVSEEWRAWMSADGKQQKMRDFARFIEDNVMDIGDPSLAKQVTNETAFKLGISFAFANQLMSTSRELTIKADVTVASVVNLQSGEGMIHFEEKHLDKAGLPLKVPSGFFVEIPVLKNGPRYQLPIRLRYERQNNAVVFQYDIYRADLTWDFAIDKVLSEVKEATALPVWRGAPES